MGSELRAVIFDIGNVLIEWQPERHFDAVIGPERRRALFAAVDLHDMNEQVDRGRNFHQMVAQTAEAHPDWRSEIAIWERDWLKMAGPVIPGSVGLLRALRAKGVPVFSLTNFGIQTFEIARPAYPFLDEFDQAYISGHMGVTKPDPRIYAMVEEGCDLPPQALLFADDRTDNIRAAAARGWQTHLFQSPEGWAECLVASELLSEREAANALDHRP